MHDGFTFIFQILKSKMLQTFSKKNQSCFGFYFLNVWGSCRQNFRPSKSVYFSRMLEWILDGVRVVEICQTNLSVKIHLPDMQ